ILKSLKYVVLIIVRLYRKYKFVTKIFTHFPYTHTHFLYPYKISHPLSNLAHMPGVAGNSHICLRNQILIKARHFLYQVKYIRKTHLAEFASFMKQAFKLALSTLCI